MCTLFLPGFILKKSLFEDEDKNENTTRQKQKKKGRVGRGKK
jgi:hypothetical protein